MTQRLVDQFNADERLWKKLEPKRRARRKLRPRLSKKKLKKLDLLELRNARKEPDCIGSLIDHDWDITSCDLLAEAQVFETTSL